MCAPVVVRRSMRWQIECELGHTALQAWTDHPPRAVRATLAGEIFVFCPDRVPCHREHLVCGLLRKDGLRGRGGELQVGNDVEFERGMTCCLLSESLSHVPESRQSN
jgi:hypothetical protein